MCFSLRKTPFSGLGVMSFALQGRGLFSGVLEAMGFPRCRTLDCSGSQGMLYSPFPLSSSFVIHANPPFELFPLLRGGVSSRCCSGRFVVHRCHRAGISGPGFLQSPFRHPQRSLAVGGRLSICLAPIALFGCLISAWRRPSQFSNPSALEIG